MGRMGSFCLMDIVSVWHDEKVLGRESADDCATLWMYLILLNCTFIMVKMENFMLYNTLALHNKKFFLNFLRCTSYISRTQQLHVASGYHIEYKVEHFHQDRKFYWTFQKSCSRTILKKPPDPVCHRAVLHAAPSCLIPYSCAPLSYPCIYSNSLSNHCKAINIVNLKVHNFSQVLFHLIFLMTGVVVLFLFLRCKN